MLLQLRDDTVRALIALDDSNVEWWQCGSRFFGDATPTSDYDFFSDDADVGELASDGFTLIAKKPGYRDTNTVEVWSKGQVHAIIVKDAELRCRAQQQIIARGLSKKQRKFTATWNKVYAQLGGVK
jgi:hypothetical protein